MRKIMIKSGPKFTRRAVHKMASNISSAQVAYVFNWVKMIVWKLHFIWKQIYHSPNVVSFAGVKKKSHSN